MVLAFRIDSIALAFMSLEDRHHFTGHIDSDEREAENFPFQRGLY